MFHPLPGMDYAKHYAALIDRARVRQRPRQLTERHHIIPRCMGGGHEFENLVRLTAEEHCVAHLLLAKIYPDNEKVVYAAVAMSRWWPELRLPKNKRYAKARRVKTGKWERQLRGNSIRARKRKQSGYSRADVARLARMLGTRAFSS